MNWPSPAKRNKHSWPSTAQRKVEGWEAGIADLQRVVILRDAGRMSEADAAMAERNERAGADAQAAAEAERAVSKSLEELRAERQKQTGRRTCPRLRAGALFLP
jgi:uncharacterized protein involved in type VI secretion and phage assembly